MSDQEIKKNKYKGKYVLFAIGFSTIAYILLASISGYKTVTLEEAKHLKQHYLIGNINLDIPPLYRLGPSISWDDTNPTKLRAKAIHGITIGHKQGYDASDRRKVNDLSFKAVLPNLKPYNKNNFKEFSVAGFGKIASIRLRLTSSRSHRKQMQKKYFESHAFKSKTPLPESPIVPGMMRYTDPSHRVFYYSDDKPEDKPIRILCSGVKKPHAPKNPSCRINTYYRDQYALAITFAHKYLPQWREINQKAEALIDSFIVSTNSATNET